MLREELLAQITEKPGIFAALDQSGGSTPEALRLYGITDQSYETEAEMFKLIHEMRLRIIMSPSFSGARVIAAILFEKTIESTINGKSLPTYLWQDRGVVPILKVDRGRLPEHDGVELMKPIPELSAVLERAGREGIVGTKMRAVIKQPSRSGIASVVAQQIEIASQIARSGLMPIIEPEILINSPDRATSEAILYEELQVGLSKLPTGVKVILKLSIPAESNLYSSFVGHPGVARILALSGGYSRREACQRLQANPGMIASFSRALVEGLQATMTETEFDEQLSAAIDESYVASTVKVR